MGILSQRSITNSTAHVLCFPKLVTTDTSQKNYSSVHLFSYKEISLKKTNKQGKWLFYFQTNIHIAVRQNYPRILHS